MNSEINVLEAPVQEQVIEQPLTAGVSKWKLDGAHSSAAFSVKHMMIANVHGAFHELSGSMNLDKNDIGKSSVNVLIKSASITTNDAGRDQHLKSAEFFEVEKYP